jgi:hypothetical protein
MNDVFGAPEVSRGRLQSILRFPEASVAIGAINATGATRNLLATVAGRHAYSLDYDGHEEVLRLTHATPGSGTWVAEVPIDDLADRDNLAVVLAWDPGALRLSVVLDEDTRLVRTGHGTQSVDLRLQVGVGGDVLFVGRDVISARFTDGLGNRNDPPAIELWDETLQAVEILLGGTSVAGFMFEVVTCNSVLVMLTTGFESYCQSRYREIEGEGVGANALAVLRRLGSYEERQAISAGKIPEALAGGDTWATVLSNRVNFQSFDDMKRAYRLGYGLSVGRDLEVTSEVIARIRRLIAYRHRVAHKTPLISILNQDDRPPEEPEFATAALARKAKVDMDAFVKAMHLATLTLRPRVF